MLEFSADQRIGILSIDPCTRIGAMLNGMKWEYASIYKAQHGTAPASTCASEQKANSLTGNFPSSGPLVQAQDALTRSGKRNDHRNRVPGFMENLYLLFRTVYGLEA